jgi:hypothetical protein
MSNRGGLDVRAGFPADQHSENPARKAHAAWREEPDAGLTPLTRETRMAANEVTSDDGQAEGGARDRNEALSELVNPKTTSELE